MMIHKKVFNIKTMNIQYMWRNSYAVYENKFLSIPPMCYVGIKSQDNG